jgi:hypothetical protein
MNRMAAGDDAGASVLFGRVLEMCPTHPTAAEMRRNADQHAQARAGAQQSQQPQSGVVVTGATVAPPFNTQTAPAWVMPTPNYNLVYGPDPVSFGARVTLVVGQTFTGLAMGAFIPSMFTGVRAEHIAGGMLLGGALGIAGSLVASMGGVTMGQAIAVNLGSGVGFGLGASVALLASGGGSVSQAAIFGLFAGGLALGTVGGAVLALQRPLSGKMSYISSMVAWTTFATSHVWIGVGGPRALTGSSSTGPVLGGLLAGGLVGGGVIGAVTAPFVNVSADRMGWIDLSTSIGWLVVGASASLFALSSGGSDIAYAWGGIAGAGIGAVFGILMTRETDRYWHQLREQGAGQPAQPAPGTVQVTTADNASPATRARRAQRSGGLPFNMHMMPGGPGQTPYGMTLAGTF